MSPATDGGSFPEDQFTLIPGVPVFAEHETEHKGKILRFGPQELQAVVDRCNQRIANTGDYAVLCLGHTPSAEARDRGVPSPPAVGFAGPFALAERQDAQGNTSYVITADFHVFNEHMDDVRKHPRRSAELWVEDRYEDMFLDPIALLGSEPPRLDMGNVYQRFQVGNREVLKYSYTMPGAGNCFVPSEVKRHSANEVNEMDNPQELVAQVVDAFMELPVVKWATAKMEEEQGAGDTTGTEAAPTDDLTSAEPEPISPEPTPAAPPAAPPAPVSPGAGDMGGNPMEEAVDEPIVDPAEREKLQRYEALDEATEDMSDEDIAEYAAGRSKRRRRRKGYQAGEATETLEEESVESADAKYAKTGDRVLYQRLKDVEAQLLEERGIRIDEQRRSQLERLADAGIQLDVDEEMERLKFSKMPDNKVFLEEAGRIQKHYGRLPTAVQLPGLLDELIDNSPEPKKYSRQDNEKVCKQAIEIAQRESIPFKQALSKAQQGVA